MEHFDVFDCDGLPTLDLDVHTIPARPGEPEHEHHDVRFLLIARPGQEISISEESLDLGWFGWDELPGDIDESVTRMAERARRLLFG